MDTNLRLENDISLRRDINENCRLIFLTCIVFKLMESFTKESITTYVGFENLYHQCKFINRRFTAKQLLLYFEQIRTTVSAGVVQSVQGCSVSL